MTDAPDLRDQIAAAVRPAATLSLADFHRIEKAVHAWVAPLLAAKDRRYDQAVADWAANDSQVLADAQRQADRADALSALLRGMARRASAWHKQTFRAVDTVQHLARKLTEARDDAKKVDAGFYSLCQVLDDRHTATVRERDEARAVGSRASTQAEAVAQQRDEMCAENDRLRARLAELDTECARLAEYGATQHGALVLARDECARLNGALGARGGDIFVLAEENAALRAEVDKLRADLAVALEVAERAARPPLPNYPAAPFGPLPYAADVDEVIRRGVLGPRAGELNQPTPHREEP